MILLASRSQFTPGGGFQAGVIFAAGYILYALVFGLPAVRKVAPAVVLETLAAAGVLIYSGTGVVTMLKGGTFLDYNVLSPGHPIHGQHWGLLAIELGVGITVFSVILTIFIAFAGRERS